MLTLTRINNITNAILSKTCAFVALGDLSITPKGLFRYDDIRNQYVDRNAFYFSDYKFIEIDCENYDDQVIDSARDVFSTQDRYLHTIIRKNYYWLHNLGTCSELEKKHKEIPEFIRQDIEIIYEEKDGVVTKYFSIPFIQKVPEYYFYTDNNNDDNNDEYYEDTGEYIDKIIYRFNSMSLEFKTDKLFIESVLIFAKNFCNYNLTEKELLEDFDNIINNFQIQMY